ncbi:AKT-interacting protein-like isoform X1 [Biomphalaria glabrata]|uniref:AKT-interacting protein-like isoform X1 n=2 Tax=Biomphalaria glabrata TaxID=6526 RepID=A0A9W3AVG9_BIOGL|nr:AKT-interacting protein-like isoform X1 [Biomphalaria glabrata]
MSTASDHVAQSSDNSSLSQPLRPSNDGRQLPSIPNSTPYSSRSQNGSRVGQALTNRGSNGYGPFFQEYSLMAEYHLLQQQKIPGVYVMPCAKTPLIWSGLIFIRQGLYQGGALRFSLSIPDNYPDGDCPKFVFEFPVFHPLVNPETGELDVKREFPRWRRNVNHLWQVIFYARRVFSKVETKSPSNPEAALLYQQDRELFEQKLSESLKLSKDRLYQPPVLDDPYALRFSPWNEAIHPDTKKQMMHLSQKCFQGFRHQSNESGSANPSDLGLSWMDPDQPNIFVKDESENN